MSVEEARAKLLMRVSHEIELDEDAVDDLILEVQAEVPCVGTGDTLNGQCVRDFCVTCTARRKLKEMHEAPTHVTR